MAYSTSNPPSLEYRATAGGADWIYNSADAIGVVVGAAYFTNAKELGMQSGDVVKVRNSTGGLASIGTITVNATTGTGTLTALTATA